MSSILSSIGVPTIFILIAVLFFSVLSCYLISKNRGADTVLWSILGGILGPIAIPFSFFSKEISFDKKEKLAIPKWLKVLTLIYGVIPILPLALVSCIATIFYLGAIINPDPYNTGAKVTGAAAIFIFIGGPMGFFGLIRSLLKKVSWPDFGMLLYGGLCYSYVIVVWVVAGASIVKPSILHLFFGLYLTVSLIVFPWHLIIMYRKLSST